MGPEAITLDQMFADELGMIARRRRWVERDYGESAGNTDVDPCEVTFVPEGALAEEGSEVRISLANQPDDLVGLALSGGGIRSASFGLGVLQALARSGVFRRIDYLSTVSGGGYIGASLSATSYVRRGEFAFDNVEGNRASDGQPSNIEDSPTVSHLRNYSNFLAPRGMRDWLPGAALIVRGIVANLFIIAPWLLAGAALTLAYNPTHESLLRLGPGLLEEMISDPVAKWTGKTLGGFFWPALGVALLALFFVGWAYRRSTPKGELNSEFKGKTAQRGGGALVLLAASLALSLQALLLAWLVDPQVASAPSEGPGFLELVKTAFLASPLVVFLVSTFGDRLAKLAGNEASRLTGFLAKQGSRLALLAGAAALPLLLWLIYLRMVYWGLRCTGGADRCLDWLPELAAFGWRLESAYRPFAVLAFAALGLWLLSRGLAPNGYSLHRLYRDRLAAAFIVHPRRNSKQTPWELDRVHNLRLSQLVRKAAGTSNERFIHGPFPLMNTALNVQASAKVNRRGRNADFFVFTPLHAGSPATGYVAMTELERADPNLNLAAIMAISGAAANSNMGANTIRPLSTTLALLNVRLGYWLPNPKRLINHDFRKTRAGFLWQEMTSKLDENTDRVLLTDGGHIENLGIYELLRRRCKVIVVADAEADAGMNFSSFIALQRYARIDLGIRIDLTWQPIAAATRAVMAANASGTPSAGDDDAAPAPTAPHAALGLIHYDDGSDGYLLYFKSSLTGDENDYVRDYGLRNPSFPHETTADQFFSEEQFEVYRALGFHVAFDALNGRSAIVMPDGEMQPITGPFGKKRSAPATAAEKVAAMLGL